MKIANPVAKLGEDLASKLLQSKGYKILERNFRRGYGEIDIIALFKGELIFIEVKTRTSKSYGTPLESITPGKLNTLTRTAVFYKHLHPELPEGLRMDAISVFLTPEKHVEKIEHIENISY